MPYKHLMDPIFDEYAKVIEQTMEPVLTPICEMGNELLGGVNGLLRAPLDEMERAFNRYSEEVKRDTKAALKATIEDPITELTKGLDNMLINCLPFYLASIIGFILYLPVQILLWVCKTFISWDLYSTEKRIWKGLKTMNDTLFPILGFHFMHFPKWVRQNCYSCIRLKTSVMKEAKNETDNVFNEKIPDMFTNRDRGKFDKAFRHFEEVFAFPEARAPEDVE